MPRERLSPLVPSISADILRRPGVGSADQPKHPFQGPFYGRSAAVP